MAKIFRFSTLLVHGGQEPGPAGATTEPIVQSSSFAYDFKQALDAA
jgi:O-acetylhomoserine (thiol)-lyase